MNRIAKAWQSGGVKKPATCPICGNPVGWTDRAPGSDNIPLIVQRITADRVMQEVVLHAGCQAECTEEELVEIRPAAALQPADLRDLPKRHGAGARIRGAIDIMRQKTIENRLVDLQDQVVRVTLIRIGQGDFEDGSVLEGRFKLVSLCAQAWRVNEAHFYASDVLEIWRDHSGEITITIQ